MGRITFLTPEAAKRASEFNPVEFNGGWLKPDVDFIVDDFSNLVIGGKYARCEASIKYPDSVVISGLDKGLSEAEILDVLSIAADRKILDFFLVRGEAVANPPCGACEAALLREIFPFMPKRALHGSCVGVEVFQPEAKESFMTALVMFEGSLHLEAAKALEQIEGKVLSGCLSW
ncbi:RNA helicase [Sarracenia purpurea var. burkii]